MARSHPLREAEPGRSDTPYGNGVALPVSGVAPVAGYYREETANERDDNGCISVPCRLSHVDRGHFKPKVHAICLGGLRSQWLRISGQRGGEQSCCNHLFHTAKVP